jgi:hypothetical protein
MKIISLKELLDNGLLFEINRSILHPLGFSISYKPSRSSDEPEALVLQRTEDAEGVLYSEKDFMDGAAKFSLFMKNYGEKIIQRRITVKNFIRQTRSDQ